MSSNRRRVLIVDPDEECRHRLDRRLSASGFVVHGVSDGNGLWQALAQEEIDIIVLDAQLRASDGLGLTGVVRLRSTLPIVLVSDRDDPIDRVLGLEQGADDFLTKPFEPRELVARMQAILRRRQPPVQVRRPGEDGGVFRFQGWMLEPGTRCLYNPDGQPVALADAERRLLEAFLQTPGLLLTRDRLRRAVSGADVHCGPRSVDLLVSRLRLKLDPGDGRPGPIRTIRRHGYLFDIEPASSLAR